MADILVVRTTVPVKKEALDILRDDILAQKEKRCRSFTIFL